MTSNTWFEFGVSYAAVLLNKQKQFLKGGFTVKLISGITNNFANVNNLSTTYLKTGNDQNLNRITTSGIVTFGSNEQKLSSDVLSYGSGTGFDLGFVYEYRPDFEETIGMKDINKYLYKIGLSVTDIGTINFNPTKVETYDVNRTITEAEYNSLNTRNLLDQKYAKIATSQETTHTLPTALHLNFDWNMHKKFYLNLNAD